MHEETLRTTEYQQHNIATISGIVYQDLNGGQDVWTEYESGQNALKSLDRLNRIIAAPGFVKKSIRNWVHQQSQCIIHQLPLCEPVVHL